MEKTFESSLAELEKIVKQLEDGDLPLEQSLKLFENGVRISRECRERLTQAERRIEILMRDENGGFRLEELNPEDDRSGDQRKPRKIITFDDDDENGPTF